MANNFGEKPIHIRQYYAAYRKMNEERLAKATADKAVRYPEMIKLRNIIKNNIKAYEENFGIKLNYYQEFIKEEYNGGSLLSKAKSLFTRNDISNEQSELIFTLIKYAKLQKEIYDLDKTIAISEKASKVKVNDYINLIKAWTLEIHEKLITEQAGYNLSNGLGVVAINRYKNLHKPKNDKYVDFNETNKLKRQLISEGKEVYDKKKAEWCKQHNIPYNVENQVVYKKAKEYINELVLLDGAVKQKCTCVFAPIKYRGREVSDVSNQDIKNRSNGDLNKLCREAVDVLVKCELALELNPMLKDKFVRYENQESLTNRKIDSKN